MQLHTPMGDEGRGGWTTSLRLAMAAAVVLALLPFAWRAVADWLARPAGGPPAVRDESPVVAPAPLAPLREIALVVPGTLAASETWFTQAEGHASFASELAAGFRDEHARRRAEALARRDAGLAARPGDGDDLRERELVVRRLLWDSSFRQANRSEAARQFAREIERQAEGYDRVHLVGHSHGGNVILLAVARMAGPVDTIVTLATPHLYFQMARSVDGETVWVPLCAPPDLAARTGRLLNVHAPSDFVADDLATWINGSTEAEGLDLTRAWQDASQDLISANDDIVSRLVGTLRVRAAPELLEEAFAFQQDLVVPSLGGIGTGVHSRLHGTRVGRRIGRVLAGADARDELTSLLLDAGSDEGDLMPLERLAPEPSAPRGAWISHVELRIDASVGQGGNVWLLSALDLDGSGPDPAVRLGDQTLVRMTDVNAISADTAAFVPDGPLTIEVVDEDLVGSQSLGAPFATEVIGGVLAGHVPRADDRPWDLELTSWPVW